MAVLVPVKDQDAKDDLCNLIASRRDKLESVLLMNIDEINLCYVIRACPKVLFEVTSSSSYERLLSTLNILGNRISKIHLRDLEHEIEDISELNIA